MKGSLLVEDCLFVNNSIERIGGVLMTSNASAIVRNSKFLDNKSTLTYGGGLVFDSGDSLVIEGCVFSRNTAGLTIGLMSSFKVPVHMKDCLISENFGTDGGFSVYNTDLYCDNVTITNNRAEGIAKSVSVFQSTLFRLSTNYFRADYHYLIATSHLSNLLYMTILVQWTYIVHFRI
jgi:hypothetical protein